MEPVSLCCAAMAGTFTVPPSVMLALPAGSYGTLYFKPAIGPIGFTASGAESGTWTR